MRKSSKEKKKEYRESNSNYFEAVLQLRDINEKQLEEILRYINENDCRIAKHVMQRNGIDLQLSSQKFIQHLGRWMKKRYNCQVISTRTLHTRDSKANKDLYRVTILANFLKYKVGDVIEYEGDKVKITSIGKKPVGKVISTGKRRFLDPKLLR